MATKILLKKSNTGGAVPLIGDLDQGELAVNLVDRKLYTKNGSGAIVTVNGAYVDSVTPANAVEGDLWYDTSTNLLKAHNGSNFVSAGYQTVADLEDTSFGTLADNDLLAYDTTAGQWTNQSPTEAGFATVATTGSYNDLSDAPVVPSAPNDATITISAGSGLAGGGNFTADQSTPETITLNVDLNELTSSTLDADGDFFVVVNDLGDQKKLDKASISLSGFSNDIGFLTTESDTLDTVTSRGSTTSNSVSVGQITTTGVGTDTFGGNVIVTGDLTVNGTTTTVNSTTVEIGDNIIVLNADEAGTPSQDAGFEVERGTETNVVFKWSEASDAWDMGNNTLQNVVLDGGTY